MASNWRALSMYWAVFNNETEYFRIILTHSYKFQLFTGFKLLSQKFDIALFLHGPVLNDRTPLNGINIIERCNYNALCY